MTKEGYPGCNSRATCYGFAGKVLQVPRNFMPPVTVSMGKCYRWNISSWVRHLDLRPSGSEKPETLPDGTGFAAFGHQRDTIRQTLALNLNCAWRFYIWVLLHQQGSEILSYCDDGCNTREIPHEIYKTQRHS